MPDRFGLRSSSVSMHTLTRSQPSHSEKTDCTPEIMKRCFKVCLQSFLGLVHSGLFYSWGAMISSINTALLGPNYDYKFSQDHGLFTGVYNY